jgi:AmmeMemoRadiSam system protein A
MIEKIDYKPLLKLARNTLKKHFQNKEFIPDKSVREKFSIKRACFVTLTENRILRGCIGSLRPKEELWKDVQENVSNASFKDPRFFPVEEKDLDKIKIEVSVLTKPKEIDFSNEKELLEKIKKEMGIILKKGFNQSTFLPQVWKQIPDKKDFLEELSLKAGLSKDAWKDCNILYYNIESVKEK